MFVDALKSKIGKNADQWIKDWLFPNLLNEGWSIPHNAPVTMIVGLQMLFEYPYQAVCEIVSHQASANIAPYVCVGDARPTEVLIVDMTTSKIVSFHKHEAWKFRFKNLKALDVWMRDRAMEISKKMGRTDVWQKLRQM